MALWEEGHSAVAVWPVGLASPLRAPCGPPVLFSPGGLGQLTQPLSASISCVQGGWEGGWGGGWEDGTCAAGSGHLQPAPPYCTPGVGSATRVPLHPQLSFCDLARVGHLWSLGQSAPWNWAEPGRGGCLLGWGQAPRPRLPAELRCVGSAGPASPLRAPPPACSSCAGLCGHLPHLPQPPKAPLRRRSPGVRRVMGLRVWSTGWALLHGLSGPGQAVALPEPSLPCW